MKKVIFTVLVVVVLISCFSPWNGGDQAKITLVLAGSANQGRAVFPPEESMLGDLEHTVVLTNGANTLTINAKGGTTIEAVVAPGLWDITVNTYLDGEIYAIGSTAEDLQPGNNNFITIRMQQAFQVTFDAMGGSAVPGQIIKKGDKATRPDSQRTGYFIVGWYLDREYSEDKEWNFENDVTESITLYAKWEAITLVPGTNLVAKLEWLQDNAQTGGEYIVVVGRDESIGPQLLNYSGNNVIITITSDGASARTISLNSNGDFAIDSGVTVVLENIILLGKSDNTKSLVRVISGGKLIMNVNSKITGNSNSTGHGGGVFADGTFIMNDGTIPGNTAKYGGGVTIWGGSFTMENGTISNNTAEYGAGVTIWGGTFNMENGIISYNTADGNTGNGDGGGVYVSYGENSAGFFNMNGGEISNNTAGYGGGVYLSNRNEMGSTFTMSGEATISVNTAFGSGGGVQLNSNTAFTMKDGTISSNAAGSGGGVDINGGVFDMENGTIAGNTANKSDGYGNGGGVSVNSAGEDDPTGFFNMKGGEISGNTATYGGGVFMTSWNNREAIFTMSDNAIISNNTASDSGGGVRVSPNTTFTMKDGTISNNKAGDGGGVRLWGGTFNMEKGTISDNAADGNDGNDYINGDGGGVYVSDNDGDESGVNSPGFFNMKGGDIFHNTAVRYGGGVFVGWNKSVIFRMSDGIIYGSNENNADLRNEATEEGAALYNANTLAEYGTFDDDGDWEPVGDLELTDRTIWIINGELQP
jgi:uncharacterized repeat protein (TIGR02543 family)